jgi:hypothetical protein
MRDAKLGKCFSYATLNSVVIMGFPDSRSKLIPGGVTCSLERSSRGISLIRLVTSRVPLTILSIVAVSNQEKYVRVSSMGGERDVPSPEMWSPGARPWDRSRNPENLFSNEVKRSWISSRESWRDSIWVTSMSTSADRSVRPLGLAGRSVGESEEAGFASERSFFAAGVEEFWSCR